jgi:hypothetical protein
MNLHALLARRRKEVRARVCASATVRVGDGPAVEHLVDCLSVSGAYLLGRPPVEAGGFVEIELARPGRAVEVAARLVRTGGEGGIAGYGVQFAAPSADARAAIEREVMAQVKLSAPARAHILVVEPTARRVRQALERIRTLGELCVSAESPDQARRCVGHWNIRIGLLGFEEEGDMPAPFATLPRTFPRVRWRRVTEHLGLVAVAAPAQAAAAARS